MAFVDPPDTQEHCPWGPGIPKNIAHVCSMVDFLISGEIQAWGGGAFAYCKLKPI